ncbi:SDR family oxidoreductase [Ectothiorhodospiraceae bacterium 2226]|nr:SDR family oxidoreductase [Ectothiorhodospiraceae bacterium 2226]
MNPLTDERLPGPPRAQVQEWPGLDSRMDPQADHGEVSYQGGNKLKGKKALITGGDSGIGRAVAIAFAREGADVAISYFNEHEDARDTTGWIEKAGRRALAMDGDLQDPAHCRSLVARTVEAFGGLNIVVNNAAYHVETSEFADISPEQLERTFRTNIFSYFWVTQAALEHLHEGDSIINTGSVVGATGNPYLTDYAGTKAAIDNLTKSLAPTLAKRGIRINCVTPGPVWTPLIPSTRDEQFVGEFGKDTLWGRPAQPIEMAPSYVFLASADSRYYSGQIFAPTGMAVFSR